MDLIADTTLLVGLWRRQAWAMSFAKANPGRCLGLPKAFHNIHITPVSMPRRNSNSSVIAP